jgi:hypothetical protein
MREGAPLQMTGVMLGPIGPLAHFCNLVSMIVLLNLTRSTTDPRAIPVTCAKCHSSAGHPNVHYLAAAATEYGTQVKGGYEYDGQTYDGESKHPAPYDTCVSCHNQHTSQLDVQECATCHTGVKTAEDLAKIRMQGSSVDYNGNGDVTEGIAAEVAGLQVKLLAAIQAYAREVEKSDSAYDAGTYPYRFTDTNGNG